MESEALLRAIKTMAWERAKGELRAVAMAQAHFRSVAMTSAQEASGRKKWLALEKRIEEFIRAVEDDGLHE